MFYATNIFIYSACRKAIRERFDYESMPVQQKPQFHYAETFWLAVILSPPTELLLGINSNHTGM